MGALIGGGGRDGEGGKRGGRRWWVVERGDGGMGQEGDEGGERRWVCWGVCVCLMVSTRERIGERSEGCEMG